MQELSLMVIDEGQQYGTDREIALISLLRQQPLVLWTGDSQQTPGGIARTAPNAKRSRQLLLAKKHGLRSDRNYYMPSNLAEAMIRLFDGSSNEGLTTLSQILRRGQHTLGQLWTNQLSQQSIEDLEAANTVLPGLRAQFEAAQPHEQRRLPTIVDTELLAGTTVNFPRSLVRLAWILQHAATLLPMAGDIQAVLNSHTAGVGDIHAWGLMLPSSSRVGYFCSQTILSLWRTKQGLYLSLVCIYDLLASSSLFAPCTPSPRSTLGNRAKLCYVYYADPKQIPNLTNLQTKPTVKQNYF